MTSVPTDPARPLRAIVVILTTWVTGRAAYLVVSGFAEPTTTIGLPNVIGPRVVATRRVASSGWAVTSALPIRQSRQRPMPVPTHVDQAQRSDMPVAALPGLVLTGSDLLTSEVPTAPPAPSSPRSVPSPVLAPRNGRSTGPAWSGSFWMAARDGSAPGLAPGGGQLGGSQAGVRLYRHLTPAISLTGRASTALATRQAEASAGIALRRGSLALLAERRFALDRGGRNDWSLTAVAGITDVTLPKGLRLDGYAQAGVVGRDGFADGALRVERTVLSSGTSRLSLGAGSWGSIQPGAARLDIGPQIVARTALAGRAIRISAEWRQRIAGNAAPGSGPAVTLGADF